MELRRAILLFAVVLAIAALVTVLSGGTRGNRDDSPAPPVQEPTGAAQASPGPDTGPGRSTVTLDADRAPTTKPIVFGSATTIAVKTDEPGTVSIPALGLTAEAEPDTPATLDVLADPTSTSLAVRFTPAGDEVARHVGRLKVKPPTAGD